MKHVLPLKEKEIEQRRLEAEARKVQRIKHAEGEAEARRIEAAAEADARRKLADADAYRIEVTGKANAEQLARDSALIAKNPLLIQKTLADKLSDKIQVDHRAAVGGRLLRRRPAGHARDRRGRRTRRGRERRPTTNADEQEGVTWPCRRRSVAGRAGRRGSRRRCATRPATTPPPRQRCGAGTGWRCGERARASCRSTTTATSAPATSAPAGAHLPVDEASAPRAGAVVRFLRDAAGRGVAGHRLRGAVPEGGARRERQTEVLASIGDDGGAAGAARCSARRTDGRDAPLAGTSRSSRATACLQDPRGRTSTERETRLCYDGGVWRHLIALPATAATERARAALALSRRPLPQSARRQIRLGDLDEGQTVLHQH